MQTVLLNAKAKVLDDFVWAGDKDSPISRTGQIGTIVAVGMDWQYGFTRYTLLFPDKKLRDFGNKDIEIEGYGE